MVSAFAPAFRTELRLTATQTSFLVAVPVLLGALARIPMGLLTDRYGGRKIFTILFVISAGALALVAASRTYGQLLASGFLLGVSGSSFAVGVAYVSKWFSAARQGTALGVYGLGTGGQSLAVFLGPVLAESFGRNGVYLLLAGVLLVWAVLFAAGARNATPPASGTSLRPLLRILVTERLSWVLALFYFLTFGGFVAFSIYMPVLLKDEFGLTPRDAGLRVAIFVVVAVVMRVAGGVLGDRFGGARVLNVVFLGLVATGTGLIVKSPLAFTVLGLASAVLLGLGNGAVFKLVPQFFPGNTGTVTGLVGAAGGLGGFFPPLVLGVLRDRTGSVWIGFVLLAATALTMWALNARVFLSLRPPAESPGRPAIT
jgi:NNP family nitrate/nitrite transporter-like MFS transporter